MVAYKAIHINCDLGEGGEFDHKIIPLISAANIACGGHAGNLESMRKTVDLALLNKVEIGAHPSYPDTANFGRKSMKMTAEDLKISIQGQVTTLKQIAEAQGGVLTHIKLHGALYNDAAKSRNISKVVVNALEEMQLNLRLYAPIKSQLHEVAMGRFEVFNEAFADRNYQADYSLVSRSSPHAIIQNREEVFQHVMEIYDNQKIVLKDGSYLIGEADTFCLHSDTPAALEILRYLNKEFASKQIQIKS